MNCPNCGEPLNELWIKSLEKNSISPTYLRVCQKCIGVFILKPEPIEVQSFDKGE